MNLFERIFGEAEIPKKFTQMSPHEFDQSDHGWRRFGEGPNPRHAVAAKAIDVYMKKAHGKAPVGPPGTFSPPQNLRFHSAQMHLMAGNKKEAEKSLKKAYFKGNTDPDWSHYVNAHRAFVRGDLKSLQHHHDKISDETNKGVAKNLVHGLKAGKSYKEVY